MSTPRPRAAVLLSGGGRTLENLARCVAEGSLDLDLALVLSSKREAFGLQRAARLGLPHAVVDPERELTPEAFGEEIFTRVEDAQCELVVLAGFLRFLPIPGSWERRVINIHPSLLPAFGGKGCYGDRVHRAVLERGVQFTGCTVHYADNEYDHGEILLQRVVPVLPEDDVEALAARVFEAEKGALPEALRLHLARAER